MTADVQNAARAAPEIRVFGVRHHGPGSARAVRHALEQFAPDVVLIEGPADADPLVRLVAEGGVTRACRHAREHFAPDVVRTEGPADADPLVRLVAEEGMTPPVALLAYAT